MLIALTPKKMLVEVEAAVEEKKKEEAPKSESKSILQPAANWDIEDYKHALWYAVFKKDEIAEQIIVEAYQATQDGQIEINRAKFEARRINTRQIMGYHIDLEKLKDLHKSNINDAEICSYLAEAYGVFKDFAQSALKYEEAAKLNTSNSENKLVNFCCAAIARAKSGKHDSDQWLLRHVVGWFNDTSDGEYTLFLYLCELAEFEKVDDKYVAYLERILAIRPDNDDKRFSLAHKYSEIGNNELALFHYQLIPFQSRKPGVWNNLEVAYARLDLKGKAIAAYKKSEELQGTLAMSNMAHALIKAGFLQEAEQLCNKATQIQDYDKQVAAAISQIDKTHKDEDEKKKNILKNAESFRVFQIDFASACINQPLQTHSGRWEGPKCELNLAIKDGQFIAEGKYEVEQSSVGLQLALIGKTGATYTPEKKTTLVKYEGSIFGSAARFKKTITEQGATSIGLFGTNTAEGLMIFNKDITEIRVYEKSDKPAERFYNLTRLS